MFKEAFTGVIILGIFFVLCRLVLKRNKKVMIPLVFTLLAISCAANLIYNSFNIFPDFYMDIVNGRFRYGTFSGNLFAYSDEFMFQDEIIFPVLRHRKVALDSTAEFYEKFFSLYSESTTSVDIDKTAREAVHNHRADFSFSHEFSCIGIMDYVTDSLPEELVPSFDEERYPMLYINTDSLENRQNLIIIMDKDYAVYIMSDDYYNQITGGKINV